MIDKIVMAALVLLIVVLFYTAAMSSSEMFSNMMWETPSWYGYKLGHTSETADQTVTYNTDRGVSPKNVQFDMATGVATITEPGRYVVNFNTFADAGNATDFAIAIMKNGEVYARQYSSNYGGYGPTLSMSTVMDLVAGDTVSVKVQNGMLHGNESTSFHGHMIASAERPAEVEEPVLPGQSGEKNCGLFARMMGRCSK